MNKLRAAATNRSCGFLRIDHAPWLVNISIRLNRLTDAHASCIPAFWAKPRALPKPRKTECETYGSMCSTKWVLAQKPSSLSVFCWRYGSDRLKATHLRATCAASFCLSSNLRSYRAPSSRSASARPAWRTTSSRGAPFLLFHPWPPRVTDPRLSRFACYIRSGLPRTRRL